MEYIYILENLLLDEWEIIQKVNGLQLLVAWWILSSFLWAPFPLYKPKSLASFWAHGLTLGFSYFCSMDLHDDYQIYSTAVNCIPVFS